MTDNDLVLRVEGLCKSFFLHHREAHIQAVSDCSFSVTAGEIVALGGPSGAGKSSGTQMYLSHLSPQ